MPSTLTSATVNAGAIFRTAIAANHGFRYEPIHVPVPKPAHLSDQPLLHARPHLAKLREVALARRGQEREEDSFFVADLSIVRNQAALWVSELPFVRPFYAVKCNGDVGLLRTLAAAGASFDCASRHEIETVLSLPGVTADRIVYANTIKTPSYLRFAANAGVSRLTFDSTDELDKISAFHPRAELLLRIATDDSGATCQLSNKFGCPPRERELRELLERARSLDLGICGVAFHIGSGGGSADDAYGRAISDANRVFDLAREFGYELSVLDIGGGFSAEAEEFKAAAKDIRSALLRSTLPPDTQLIAEPGRFFAANAFSLCASVIGRREQRDGDMLYVSDGVYGNLNCIIYDHQVPRPELLTFESGSESTSNPADDLKVHSHVASVWGPTCDGIDKISESARLPRRAKVGDWLYFENVGAYTLSAATTFNGFCHSTEVHYI